MAWGVDPFGRSFWGGGTGTGGPGVFTVDSAVVLTSSVVRVTFTKAPRFMSSIYIGDASRVTNWTILSSSNVPVFILGIAPVEGDVYSLDVTILGRWAADTYQVIVANVLDVSGDALSAPKNAFFLGCAVAAKAAALADRLIDLRNPQTDKNVVNGALITTSSGQYDRESGIPLLKKLIIRRLTTVVDSYLHLVGHNYGLGLRSKDVFRNADLVTLKADVEQQVKLEPEVSDCTATISFTQNVGPVVLLSVTVAATGQVFGMSVPFQQLSQAA